MFDGPLVTVTVCLRWLPSWLPELAGHISRGGFQSNFWVRGLSMAPFFGLR
jgi:hypothetical protein